MENLSTISDIIIRSVAVYFFVILAIRLFGKKELSQLSIIDLVFILLISNSVQNAMVGPNTSLLGGICAAGTLFIVNYLLKMLLFKSSSTSHFLQGEAVMLIHKGHAVKKNLDAQRISMEELHAAVREHGVEAIEDVDLAVLEVDGNISILSGNYRNHSSKRRKVHKSLSQNP